MSTFETFSPADQAMAQANFRKADPPVLGDKFAPTWHDNTPFITLPGGGLLHFDLDKLTLSDYRSMRNHYQINISLSLLSFMIHQSDWKIECDDDKIREFVQDELHEMWTRLIRAISPAFWAGHAPTVIEWKNDPIAGKVRLNKFKDIRPEDAAVNWKEVDGYARQGHIPPKIKVFDGMKIRGHVDPIPVVNSFWFPILTENGDMGGRKLLKPAFPSWFYSQIIHLYSNRYFERFGEPLPVGRAPFDERYPTGQGDQTQSGKEVMQSVLDNIRNRSAVVLPSSRSYNHDGSEGDYQFQIDYLDSQMKGADFERYLTRLDEEMSLGIFTPVLLYRTADVGSYNLGEAHMEIFLVMMNSLISDLADYVNRYVLDRLVDFNFSPRAPRARMSPRKLGKDTNAIIRTVLQTMIQNDKASVDVEDIGEALGMKVHEIRQVQADTQPDATGTPGVPGSVGDSSRIVQTPGTSPSRLSAAIDNLATFDITSDYTGLPGRHTFENALMVDSNFDQRVAEKAAYDMYGIIDQFVREATAIGMEGDELKGRYEQLVRAEAASI